MSMLFFIDLGTSLVTMTHYDIFVKITIACRNKKDPSSITPITSINYLAIQCIQHILIISVCEISH